MIGLCCGRDARVCRISARKGIRSVTARVPRLRCRHRFHADDENDDGSGSIFFVLAYVAYTILYPYNYGSLHTSTYIYPFAYIA